MTLVRFTGNLKRNGVRFKVGDIVPVETEESVKELLALGVVEVVDGEAPQVTEQATVDPVAPVQEPTPTEETVNPVPLEEQLSESVSQAPSQPSEPSSTDGEPSPEQIAQDVADI